MAEQVPHQETVVEYVMSCTWNYYHRCVGFAQRNGPWPDFLAPRQETRLPDNHLGALSQLLDEINGTEVVQHDIHPGQFDANLQNPYPVSWNTDRPGTLPQPSDEFQSTEFAQHAIRPGQFDGNLPDPASVSWDNDIILQGGQTDDAETSRQHHASSPPARNQNTVTQWTIPQSGPPPPQSLRELDLASSMPSEDEMGMHGLAVLYNYDHLWAQKMDFEPLSGTQTRNSLVLDELFSHGVLRKGDCLVAAVNFRKDGAYHEDEAILRNVGFSKVTRPSDGYHRNYPNFIITMRQDPNDIQTLQACRGTTAIFNKFKELGLNFNKSNTTRNRNDVAEKMNVWRGDKYFGTLRYVRQAYQFWGDDMDETNRDWRTQ